MTVLCQLQAVCSAALCSSNSDIEQHGFVALVDLAVVVRCLGMLDLLLGARAGRLLGVDDVCLQIRHCNTVDVSTRQKVNHDPRVAGSEVEKRDRSWVGPVSRLGGDELDMFFPVPTRTRRAQGLQHGSHPRSA